mmetsp:Transcript_14384/g.31489  ORF Transcript_14384/g.31489 Transcript_14384/m.31489 type:complete len:173 (+) Transcript_14384:1271-1789(+)
MIDLVVKLLDKSIGLPIRTNSSEPAQCFRKVCKDGRPRDAIQPLSFARYITKVIQHFDIQYKNRYEGNGKVWSDKCYCAKGYHHSKTEKNQRVRKKVIVAKGFKNIFTYTQRIKKSKLSLISKSMEYKSLENRERILPVGVVSKNDMGALSTEASKFLCSTPEALTPNFARI